VPIVGSDGANFLDLLRDVQLDDKRCFMHEVTSACSVEALAMLSELAVGTTSSAGRAYSSCTSALLQSLWIG